MNISHKIISNTKRNPLVWINVDGHACRVEYNYYFRAIGCITLRRAYARMSVIYKFFLCNIIPANHILRSIKVIDFQRIPNDYYLSLKRILFLSKWIILEYSRLRKFLIQLKLVWACFFILTVSQIFQIKQQKRITLSKDFLQKKFSVYAKDSSRFHQSIKIHIDI